MIPLTAIFILYLVINIRILVWLIFEYKWTPTVKTVTVCLMFGLIALTAAWCSKWFER